MSKVIDSNRLLTCAALLIALTNDFEFAEFAEVFVEGGGTVQPKTTHNNE